MATIDDDLAKAVTEGFRQARIDISNQDKLLTGPEDVEIELANGQKKTGPSWPKIAKLANDADLTAFTAVAGQVRVDAQQVANDKTAAGASKDAAKTSETNSKTSETNSASRAAAALASQNASKTSETNSAASAASAKTDADRAQLANPDNQLKKAQNLADLPDKAVARTNLQLDRVRQFANNTQLKSPDGNIRLTIDNNGWSVYNDAKAAAVPLGIGGGGTGATGAAGARTNLGALGVGDFGIGADSSLAAQLTTITDGYRAGLYRIRGEGVTGATPTIGAPAGSGNAILGMISVPVYSTAGLTIAFNRNSMWTGTFNPNTPAAATWKKWWGEANTTVDTNGFIKKASPVVKLFADGYFETNDESEGCKVTRQGAGEYLIEGCMGMNADAVWGGIDGGFDIPKDRNQQPLIWLDYEVNADGSVVVKTYHRTHPDAPAFARNIIDGIAEAAPVDIPSDQFVSVRVEMPENSLWNQKMTAAQKGMNDSEHVVEETDAAQQE